MQPKKHVVGLDVDVLILFAIDYYEKIKCQTKKRTL